MKQFLTLAHFENEFLGKSLKTNVLSRLSYYYKTHPDDAIGFYLIELSEQTGINRELLLYLVNRFENYINGYFDEAEYDAIKSIVNAVRSNNAN